MSFELPLNESQVIQELKRRQTLPKNPSPELLEYAKEFDRVYENIHQISMEILTSVKKIFQSHNLKPGKIVLILVGGRLYGKELTLESDLDFIIGIENEVIPLLYYDPKKNMESKKRLPKEADETKRSIFREIAEIINTIVTRESKICWTEFKGIYELQSTVKRFEDEGDILYLAMIE